MKVGAVIRAQKDGGHGRALEVVGETTVLGMVLERAMAIKGVDLLVVSTTSLIEDRPIARTASAFGIEVAYGPIKDAWERHKIACQGYGLDVIVRLDASKPLFDPRMVEPMVRMVGLKSLLYAGTQDWPIGMDVEVFSAERFVACQPQSADDQRGVTGPIRRVAEQEKRAGFVKCSLPLQGVKWSIETSVDVDFLRLLAPTLEPGNYKLSHTLARATDLIQQLPPDSPALIERRA